MPVTLVTEPKSLVRSLLASSGDCIKILDLDGNLIFMTDGGQRVMEVADFSAIKGCPWPDFWEGQGKLDTKAAIETALAGGTGHFQGFASTMAGTPKWWDVTVTAIPAADGRPDKLLAVSRDITDAWTAAEAIKASEARFKMFAQAMPNQVWSATPDGRLDWLNTQAIAYSGLEFSELIGNKWVQIVHPEDIGPATTAWLKALETGDQYQTEFRLRRSDGTFRWHLARALPIKDAAGIIKSWIGTNTDIEDQKASQARQELLALELEHRIKNILAMVGAIARQTFQTTQTKEDAEAVLTGRLAALNQAHDVLIRSSWSSASMPVIVDGALAAHQSGSRIRTSGPMIHLPAKQALSLTLVLHELATNAAKYGSLSVPHGTIDVTWHCHRSDDAQSLRFSWQESGGPPVKTPTRRGFGSRLIQATLSADFGSSAKVEYRPDGLMCSFDTSIDVFPDAVAHPVENEKHVNIR